MGGHACWPSGVASSREKKNRCQLVRMASFTGGAAEPPAGAQPRQRWAYAREGTNGTGQQQRAPAALLLANPASTRAHLLRLSCAVQSQISCCSPSGMPLMGGRRPSAGSLDTRTCTQMGNMPRHVLLADLLQRHSRATRPAEQHAIAVPCHAMLCRIHRNAMSSARPMACPSKANAMPCHKVDHALRVPSPACLGENDHGGGLPFVRVLAAAHHVHCRGMRGQRAVKITLNSQPELNL